MNIVNVNANLINEMRLYPMQGFYLLHVPLMENFARLRKTLLGEQHVVIVGENAVLIVKTHAPLIALLKEHQAMGNTIQLARLGILTYPVLDAVLTEAVSFTEYGAMDEIPDLLAPSQIQLTNQIMAGESLC